MEPRPRVVVACPDPLECELLTDWLSAEHEPVAARQLQAAVRQVQSARPRLIVADARVAFDDAFLSAWRGGGAVSPLVVVGDKSSAAEAAARRHGAFYVVRPMERDLLLCSVAMALVEARPTRRSPRFVITPLDATANGVEASLIDVANEGLRLELRSGRQSALPPFFSVNVPLIGLSLVVQRIWTSTTGRLPGARVLCGGALADNAARQVQKWRSFVEMVPRAR